MRKCIVCKTEFYAQSEKQITCGNNNCQNEKGWYQEQLHERYIIKTQLQKIFDHINKNRVLISDKGIKRIINDLHKLL